MPLISLATLLTDHKGPRCRFEIVFLGPMAAISKVPVSPVALRMVLASSDIPAQFMIVLSQEGTMTADRPQREPCY